jgi:RNA recognition motif-containing protein
MNIYVSNLSFNLQDEELKDLFTAYGEVTSSKIITDKMTNKSRGFGFVEMANNEEAKKAIAGLDNTTIDNRSIHVMEARPKEERSTRSNFNNSRGGYSGY